MKEDIAKFWSAYLFVVLAIYIVFSLISQVIGFQGSVFLMFGFLFVGLSVISRNINEKLKFVDYMVRHLNTRFNDIVKQLAEMENNLSKKK